MPQPHTLLLRIQVYRAGAARRCYHDSKHAIAKGDIVLQLQLTDATKGYCAACAAEMITRARAHLEYLGTELLDPAADQNEYEKRFKNWKKKNAS